jgi:hypothetical protein
MAEQREFLLNVGLLPQQFLYSCLAAIPRPLSILKLAKVKNHGRIDRGSKYNWLGHESLATTQRYLGVSTELRREAVNRLSFPEVKAESSSTG